MCLVQADSERLHYGSRYPRQFVAGILLVESRQFVAGILFVAQHILSGQSVLDLSAELAVKFDNKIVCIKYDRLYYGCMKPKPYVVHLFQFCVDRIN